MPRTTESDNIHDAFLDAVRGLGASIETMNQLAEKSSDVVPRMIFRRLGQSQRELYFVRGVGLVNVHVRSDPPGFWGVEKSVKSDLDQLFQILGLSSFYVFLVGTKSRKAVQGYIARDLSGAPFVKRPSETPTAYKINERSDLDEGRKRLSLSGVARDLLSIDPAAAKESVT